MTGKEKRIRLFLPVSREERKRRGEQLTTCVWRDDRQRSSGAARRRPDLSQRQFPCRNRIPIFRVLPPAPSRSPHQSSGKTCHAFRNSPARPPGAAGHPAGLGRKGIPDTQNTTLKEFNEHMNPLIYHLFGTVSRVCQRKKQYLCGCREFFRRDFLLSSRAEAAGRGWIGNHLRTSS